MDAQELRNLQEAYMEVYELDEAMSSYDRNRQRAAQRAAERNAARKAGKTGNVPGVGYVSPRPERETYRDSAGVERHTSGARMPKKEDQKESFDLFDVILEHLVAEGYADTNEAALAIMANMSEEWRQSIVEGYVDWQKGSLTVPSRVQGNKRTESPYERASKSQFRKMADAQTTRGTQAVRGARGRKAKLAAKQSDVIQQVTQKYHNK